MGENNGIHHLAVATADIKHIDRTLGVTHAGSGARPCAGGTMQHLALNVDTLDDLLAMRDRIRSRGIIIFGPLDHGMCHSIYFAGPEDLTLEVATSAEPSRPWQRGIPEELYTALISMPDDVVTAQMSENTPPVATS